MLLAVLVIVNMWFYILFRKSDEFAYLKDVILNLLKKYRRHENK